MEAPGHLPSLPRPKSVSWANFFMCTILDRIVSPVTSCGALKNKNKNNKTFLVFSFLIHCEHMYKTIFSIKNYEINDLAKMKYTQ